MTWSNHFLAFDTETTGFGSDARVLELALVEYVNGVPTEVVTHTFCPAGVEWEDEKVKQALQVNKLSMADLDGAPEFQSVVEEVTKLLTGVPVWVAHNIEFDLRMLRQEYQRLGQELPPVRFAADTMALDFLLNPKSHGWKLGEVAARHQINLEGVPLHRAEGDAKLSAQILLRLLARMPEEEARAKELCEQARVAWQRFASRRHSKK